MDKTHSEVVDELTIAARSWGYHVDRETYVKNYELIRGVTDLIIESLDGNRYVVVECKPTTSKTGFEQGVRYTYITGFVTLIYRGWPGELEYIQSQLSCLLGGVAPTVKNKIDLPSLEEVVKGPVANFVPQEVIRQETGVTSIAS
jgi:hypothetical protein